MSGWGVVPSIRVADLDAALAFYVDRLGFEAQGDTQHGNVSIARGDARLMLETMADFYGWDLVVHGSDVARATGQEWSVSDAEAADLHATADGWGPALHSEGVCADAVEVGPDASVTDRLLARLGRDPGWQPSIS